MTSNIQGGNERPMISPPIEQQTPVDPASKKPVNKAGVISDTAATANESAQKNKEKTGAEKLQPGPPLEPARAAQLQKSISKGNPYMKPNVLVAFRAAFEKIASQMAQVRFGSQEAGLEALDWMMEEAISSAAETRASGELQAQMHEARARQHMINGYAAVGTAIAMGMSYGASRVSQMGFKNRGETKQLREVRNRSRDQLNKRTSDAGHATRQREEIEVSNASKERAGTLTNQDKKALKSARAKERVAADKKDKADSEYKRDQSTYVQQKQTARQSYVTSRQIANQFIEQIGKSVTEFTEAATSQHEAVLTRLKAGADAKKEMNETYKKLADVLYQATERDARDARDAIAKAFQELDQKISQQYKTFGIGVHGG